MKLIAELIHEIESARIDPIAMLRPQRAITGMSAVLLPFTESGEVDWAGFERLVSATVEAGLWPAVNMDTGYANLIDDRVRTQALAIAQRVCGKRPFVAGAIVADQPGDAFAGDAYHRAIDAILSHDGVPVIFQSYGLTRQEPDQIVECYGTMGRWTDRFIAFELGTMFAPFGCIYDLATYAGLLQIPHCIGAKHSSLRRQEEWRRILLRDALRPDFMVLTGNDLAIDMVMYGSDYLLGLSTCCPDAFAQRDAMWKQGDDRFYKWNDLLQYLGQFIFRDPVPGYKHDAAMFLKLRGQIACDATHPDSPKRPDADRAVLAEIMERLNGLK